MEVAKRFDAPVKTAAYVMNIRDTDLKVDSTNGAFQVTLPPVAECAGMQYIIRQMASANIVTIVDKGDAITAINTTISTATGALGFRSNGEKWFVEFTVA
jgi:hypothetical protein